MTPLYEFSGDDVMGLTTCVPIQKGNEFGGAFCADIIPYGPLNQYYDIKDDEAYYMIYSKNVKNETEQDPKFSKYINTLVFKGKNYDVSDIKVTHHNNTVARLFENTVIDWGTIEVNGTSYIFIDDHLEVKFPDLNAQVLNPNDRSVFCDDGDHCSTHYHLVFLYNFDKLSKQLDTFKRELKNTVFKKMLFYVTCFSILFFALMTWFLVTLVNAITRPVIELYELINHIVERGKGVKTKLSFKTTNLELNNLNLTFNKIVQTMQIATLATQKANSATALLNYYEAVKVFKEFQNHKAVGMCKNNIACLLFKEGDFLNAEANFKDAVDEIGL